MANIYNGNIKINIFGASHAPYIGASLDGIAPGVFIDSEKIKKDLDMRRPDAMISNARIEEDEFEIISGIYNGYTTGEEIVILIKNKEHNPNDYTSFARPSHADYTAYKRSLGYSDLRGGGARSGRLTAALVAVGSIAKDILERKGITFSSKALISDETIKNALDDGDSIGAKVNVKITGVEAGIGEPYFDSIESVSSHLLFSIPAVKAVEFGLGTGFDHARGSEVNDEFTILDGSVRTTSNNNGGIIGGVSNGEKISVTVTIKPTPTIAKEMNMLNLDTMEIEKYSYSGRHDACIAKRAGIIVEDTMALALLELYVSRYGYLWMK